MKEKLKRFLASIAAVVMAVAMMGSVTAFAAETTVDSKQSGTGSITIKNTVTDETYSVYKVFDASPVSEYTSIDHSSSNESDTRQIAYTYTKNGDTDNFLTALQGENSPFTLTRQGSSDIYNVTLKTDKTATDIVTFLNAQKDNLGSAVATQKAEASATGSQVGNDIKVTNLKYGYYYITTTTGSAVTVDSAAKDVTVTEKNSVPSIDKKQSLTDGNYVDTDLTTNIGDTVYFQITVTAGKTNNGTYTVTDILSNGLTLNYTRSGEDPNYTYTITDLSVQKHDNGAEAGSDITNTNYTISDVTDRGFKITFTADYVKTLVGENGSTKADTIVIKYSAKINNNAVINNKTDETSENNNTAKLEYSQQTTTDVTKVKTYEFELIKTDATDSSKLSGVKFTLQKATGTSSYTAGDYYKAPSSTSGSTDAVWTTTKTELSTAETTGKIDFKGLAAGTYILTETETLAGYNKLTDPIIIKISDTGSVTYVNGTISETTISQKANATESSALTDTDSSNIVDMTITNEKGTVLPSTGGIGTTLFYTIGGILVAGAVILLIVRRRKNA